MASVDTKETSIEPNAAGGSRDNGLSSSPLPSPTQAQLSSASPSPRGKSGSGVTYDYEYGRLPFFNQATLRFDSDDDYNTPERAHKYEVDFLTFMYAFYRTRIRISWIIGAVLGLLTGSLSVASSSDASSAAYLPSFLVPWVLPWSVPIEQALLGIVLTFLITGPTKSANGDGIIVSWVEECAPGFVYLFARLPAIFWASSPVEAFASTFSPYGLFVVGVVFNGPLAMRYTPIFRIYGPLVIIAVIAQFACINSLYTFITAILSSVWGIVLSFLLLNNSHRDEMNLRQYWWQDITLQQFPSLVDRNKLPFFREQLGNMPDADKELLDEIKDVKFTPVFVTGIHRSGTTFLYEKLCRITKAAKMTVWDEIYYPRLLRAHKDGTAAQEQRDITNYWAAIGVKDRQMDTVLVNAGTPEEYGYIIGRQTLSCNFHHTPTLIRHLCQKLVVTQKPTPEGFVLLKNPWDFGFEDKILQHFPNAKFIYIQRSPSEIFDSYLNFSKFHIAMKTHEPYFWLLLPRWIQFAVSGQRIFYAVWGERAYLLFTIWQFTGYFIRQHIMARKALASIPKESLHVCQYSKVIGNLQFELGRISKFLGIEFEAEQVTAARSNSKRKLEALMDVSAAKARFLAAVAKAGLPLDENTSLF